MRLTSLDSAASILGLLDSQLLGTTSLSSTLGSPMAPPGSPLGRLGSQDRVPSSASRTSLLAGTKSRRGAELSESATESPRGVIKALSSSRRLDGEAGSQDHQAAIAELRVRQEFLNYSWHGQLSSTLTA